MHSQENKIIELDRVTVGYDHNIILPDVSLHVSEGDFMAVTGPNGGGKTSLLRVILGLIKPESGKVRFYNNGVEVKSLNIGYLPQKNAIDHRFPITVEEVVGSGLLRKGSVFNNKLTEEENKKVDSVLELVGMLKYRKSSIGNLSGGQLQRVLFGRSVISNPSVLILDEPLSYVDKAFEAQFYEIVETLSHDTTIILVSHEISRIMQMANRHLIVDHGIEDCHAQKHFIRTDCV
ncbi:MAG: ATP-binding cassette domain-containing protein [Muribaculaceae bacterium]|nr:ATP-binding cassette domain-containing protein [Muribaculaceae bacterium]